MMYLARRYSVKKVLFAFGIVAIITGAIQAVRFQSKAHVATDVRRVLDAHIAPGSTRAQVESYLDSAQVSYMYAAGTHFGDRKDSLIALARGEEGGRLVPSSSDEVQIRFRFDDSQRLLNYEVRTGADRYSWLKSP
jgi:hypothetical protein